MEGLKEKLSRIPMMIIGVLYVLYVGGDFYMWKTSDTSELGQKRAALKSAQQELEGAKNKVKAAEDFVKSLDDIRARIRSLAADLDSAKANLASEVDVANFLKLIKLECDKLNMKLRGMKPEQEVRFAHYAEVPFIVTIRGAYVQFLVLFDRIAKLHQPITPMGFEFKPTGNAATKFVELEGNVRITAYRYVGNEADQVVNRPEMKENAPLPNAPAGHSPAQQASPDQGGP